MWAEQMIEEDFIEINEMTPMGGGLESNPRITPC